MAFPRLTDVEVKQAVPEADEVRFLDRGGQKVVFACKIGGRPYVLKFLRPNPRPLATPDPDASVQAVSLDDVTARARREVATLKQCDTPHLVKIGPIELLTVKIGTEDLLCFSEEFIDGAPIKNLIKPNQSGLTSEELVKLGLHVAEAIDALWTHRKIHRDIKPQNIMRRTADGSFVVLDMGLVFDLNDESWSMSPVGTLIYFSPEQMDFSNRRQVLDFRSDLFSLGVTMYQLATGVHPFVANAQNSWEVLNNIKNRQPAAPHVLQPGIPEPLSEIILRLLAKRPALRYRRISMLRDALSNALQPGGS
ncbi:MAG: serine/threonine-protein kinase [Phycisphaerae bacterium]